MIGAAQREVRHVIQGTCQLGVMRPGEGNVPVCQHARVMVHVLASAAASRVLGVVSAKVRTESLGCTSMRGRARG
jgi:hypothetical protein